MQIDLLYVEEDRDILISSMRKAYRIPRKHKTLGYYPESSVECGYTYHLRHFSS